MIVIQGTMKVQADKTANAAAAATEMRTASIAEEGCHAYRFGFATDDPETLMVQEQWEDDAALDAHMATPHMAKFGEALGGILAGAPDVTRFEVSSSRPLMG